MAAPKGEPREVSCRYCDETWTTRAAVPRKHCPTCSRLGTPCARCGTRFKAGRLQFLCAGCSLEWGRCASCEKILSAEAFPPNPAQRLGRQSHCYACYKRKMRGYHLKKYFGLSVEVYELLLKLQGGACAICGKKPRTQMLAVDHDHATGQIRGLLCSRCNHKLLGSANEDPAILRRAADYLESPSFQLEMSPDDDSPLSIRVGLLPEPLRSRVTETLETHEGEVLALELLE